MHLSILKLTPGTAHLPKRIADRPTFQGHIDWSDNPPLYVARLNMRPGTANARSKTLGNVAGPETGNRKRGMHK